MWRLYGQTEGGNRSETFRRNNDACISKPPLQAIIFFAQTYRITKQFENIYSHIEKTTIVVTWRGVFDARLALREIDCFRR